MKRYTSYKPSGVPWLGDVPAHWKVKKLKHLVKALVGGATPTTSEPALWDDVNGTPWVAIGDMSNRYSVMATNRKVSSEGILEKRMQILRAGTVIYSMYASVGYASILGVDAVTNQAILGLITTDKLNNKFFMNYLNSIRESVLQEASSNTQDNINAEKVRRIPLLCPPLEEQQAIADYLDTETARIDTLVQEKEDLIGLLKEWRQSMIAEVVTKGLDKTVTMKPSGVPWLGDVPVHWISAKLKFRLERNDGGAWGDEPQGEKDTLVLRSTEQTVDGRWKIEDPAYRKLSPTEAEATLLVEGDLLVTKSSGSETHIGKTSLVNADIAGLRAGYSNFMQRLRVIDDVIPKYVWYLLNSDTTKTQVNILASTTTGLANLNAGVLGRLVLAYPPPEEQQAIADYLDTETAKIDALIEHAKDDIVLLKELRSATIADAVLGRIDVRTH